MIQVRKYGEHSDANNPEPVGHWTLVGEFKSEDELLERVSEGSLAPGLFRIYTATKALVDEGPAAQVKTPQGLNWKHDIPVGLTGQPKAKIEAA